MPKTGLDREEIAGEIWTKWKSAVLGSLDQLGDHNHLGGTHETFARWRTGA